ncbi:uncharacterized protein LOC131167387 [Malania oleifera]|uniref:uncharacterized protein LOC131167387 n=1 Tax=Malania oleifera TaxID=397392 RepID=UPI0025AE22DB|nr:uncharacterized protein LOC131167387 [Malania oleifera]
MAIFFRHAFSFRNILLVRSSLLSRNLSHAVFSSSLCNSGARRTLPELPAVDFLRESRRGFSKGKKSRDDNDDAKKVELPPDFVSTIKTTASSQMDAAVVALSRDLSKLRTGRASTGMLDHIIVETGGVKMPLNRLAVVSVMDSKTLSVTPYDSNGLKALENAIVSSPLGLNPRDDGQRLIAVIPPLTKEHMQAMCKVVSKSCEDVKQSIRRARQKALDTIKKAGSSLPKDTVKKLEKEVDELTKKFVKSAEDMCKAKEKEINEG